ncbi:uncharacterized protein PAC_15052 [Phialocephala subalpina]|uniref:Ankyrin n=1 Tax=Phialocephala subalpina TaxID=576137 RepID=A0A1L7XJD0_9HELO|nr:uncharacterized protein PAC_15052 [Phialocephala subalpina]
MPCSPGTLRTDLRIQAVDSAFQYVLATFATDTTELGMPSYLEQYPEDRSSIRFLPLENLIGDKCRRLTSYPSLEYPRQKFLNSNDSTIFRTISRDYCLLESPGFTSWQCKKAQQDPHITILHTDKVRVPIEDPGKKGGRYHDPEYHGQTHGSYLNRWYLQGFTKEKVEAILMSNFGLAVPLSYESSADHWIPAVQRYSVEVLENTWEDRLAVFFDANVATSLQSLGHRISEYSQKLKEKPLGERYLGIWRARWDKVDEDLSTKLDIVRSVVTKAPAISAKQIGEGGSSQVHGRKPRGRKRRRFLRQLKGGSSRLNKREEQHRPVLEEVKPETSPIGQVRGRIKRRYRRRNRGVPKKPLSDKLSESPHEVREELPALGDKTLWQYNNGEPSRENPNNEFPIGLYIRLNPEERQELDCTEAQIERALDRAFLPKRDVPVVTIRTLQQLVTSTTPKRYRLISYFNPSKEIPALSLDEPKSEREPESWWGSKDDEQPPQEDYEIHIADLIDEVGVIDSKGWRANTLFSVVAANPLAFLDPQHTDDGDQVDSIAIQAERDRYWHKFAVLTYGCAQVEDIRALPYSRGYGVEHRRPVLFYRQKRWGHFDVDNACRESKRPRWRAAWKFQLQNKSDVCGCSLNDVRHDLGTCRYMFYEQGDNYSQSWKEYPVWVAEILSDYLYFAHQPHEFLERLEHKLHLSWPRYEPPAGEEETAEPPIDIEALVREATRVTPTVGTPQQNAMAVEQDSPKDSEASNNLANVASTNNSSSDSSSMEDSSADNSSTVSESPSDLAKRLAREKKEKKERDVKEKKERETKNAERIYETGICRLMGLGMSKDIDRGILLLTKAALRGSSRGKATVSRIAGAYGRSVEVPGKMLKNWLWDAGLHGSRTALEELKMRYPDTYGEVVEIQKYAFDLSYPETLGYENDILPHFDLGNVSLLSNQLEQCVANLVCKDGENSNEPNPTLSIASLQVLAELKDNWQVTPLYNFGSLLHIACAFGFVDAVNLLLHLGFDIEGQSANPGMRTPLLCSLKRGHAAIARLLIDRGASCSTVVLWSEEEYFCSTPTALHHLVNVGDEDAEELARILVKRGMDVNSKCSIECFKSQMPTDIPVLKGRSITPLRWAVIHQKPRLVRILLELGAKFAYEEYIRSSMKDETEYETAQKGYLMLETPCTELEILQMFFHQARVHGLPSEFSQTPLGLLLSEDDGPERRLRPGFENFDKVRDALSLLLELQPGHEDEILWSAVRHDHIDIVRYLLEELLWSIESRWQGLTCLHTAVLYGRTEIVQYLLSHGANPKARTTRRELTCLHLLMLVVRDPKTDQRMWECVSNQGIDVDVKENVDGLTAFHLAVRNRKLDFVRSLLDKGAGSEIPVADQLNILSQGKTGFLETVPSPPPALSSQITILGEVVIQYIQDNFYHPDYIANLLFLFLDRKPQPLSISDLMVDPPNKTTLLHLFAVLDEGPQPPRKRHEAFNPPKPDPVHTATASLLQLTLLRSHPSTINTRDAQGDTPLHFACAAHQLHAIHALLAAGADPSLKNNLGLRALDILVWSVFFLGGNTLRFHDGRKSWHPNIDFSPGYQGRKYKRSTFSPSALSLAITVFKELGQSIDPRLKRLVLAWNYAKDSGDESRLYWDGPARQHLEFVPIEVADGIEGNDDPDEGRYDRGWEERIKRKYTLATVAGPAKRKSWVGTEAFEKRHNLDFERGSL